ncbi:MAG: hypothetical protein ACOY5Y_07155 [Pseudomonadota bacterium]
MRDASFTIDPDTAPTARPPFVVAFVARRPTEACWWVTDGRGVPVAAARRRAGARAAQARLYQQSGAA